MAKQNMKKLMAVTLAMSMCWSTLSVQAFAAEASAEEATPGVNITVSGDGTAESPTVTVTVTETTEDNKTTTETDTEWTGETKTESETGDGEDDGTVTTVTGEESKVETETVDRKDRPTQQTGKVEGEETTKTETTETEVKEDQVIGTDTDDIDTTTSIEGKDAQTEWEENATGDQWEEGTPNYEGTWTPAGTEPVVEEGVTDQDGWKENGTPTQKTETKNVEIPDPLDKTNVILEMKPGGRDEEQRKVTVEEILMENDDWNGFDFGVVEALKADKDGKIVTETTKGNVTVKVVKEAVKENGVIVGYTVTTTETTVTPGTPGSPVDTGETPETEAGYTKGSVTPAYPETADDNDYVKTDAEGKVIEGIQTQIQEIKDGDTVIGYRITRTTTTPNHDVDTPEATGETTTEKAPVETGFKLPAKPAESEKTENGVTIKVVVEDVCDANGKQVGYKTITTKTKDGKVIYTGAETIYGTATTVNKTTVTDPTTKKVTTDTTTVTTTVTEIYGVTETRDVALTQERTTNIKTTEVTDQEIYQLVETDGGKFFLYEGKMYAVVAEEGHGKVTDNVDLDVDLSAYPARKGDIRGNPGDGGGYTGQTISDGKVTDSKLRHIGYGLYSDYLIQDEDGQGHDTRQYALKDKNGDVHYVYCVELGTNIKEGSYYVEDEMSSGSLYGNGYGNVSKISSVANNGFWGTTEGIGSLDAVKDLLTRNGYADVAKSLTPGQALAATQAAIWEYGTDGEEKVDSDDLVDIKFTYENGKPGALRDGQIPANEIRNIETLRNLLVNLANNQAGKGAAEKIDANDITAGAIEIKSKNTDQATGNDTFNTDLSFTLAVSTSSINGDLIVHVIQDGQVITTKRLAGTNDGKEKYATIHPDKNGTYTISDVVLAENVTITLNLEGTQHLADGVYIYKSSDYQDFVGLSKQEHAVNLEVDMTFNVEEPVGQMTTTKSSGSKEKNDTLTETRSGSRADIRTGTTTQEMGGTAVTTGTETTVVYADVTVTEVTESETLREWAEEWLENFKYPSKPTIPEEPDTPDVPDVPEEIIDIPDEEEEEEKVPLDEIPEELIDPEEEPQIIPSEEEVPLNDVPKTGDMSALWYGLSLLSGGGILGLLTGRKGKKEL